MTDNEYSKNILRDRTCGSCLHFLAHNKNYCLNAPTAEEIKTELSQATCDRWEDPDDEPKWYKDMVHKQRAERILKNKL